MADPPYSKFPVARERPMDEGVTEEHFYKHFDLNVLALILPSQEAAKHFRSDGGSISSVGLARGGARGRATKRTRA